VKKLAIFFVKLCISIILIILIFNRVDLDKLEDLVSQVQWTTWFFPIIFMFVQILLLTRRWQWVINLNEKKVDYMGSLKITIASLIANILFISSVSGVAVKIWLTSRSGFPIVRSICAAIADRMLTLLALVILAITFFHFSRHYIEESTFYSMVAILIGLAALVFLLGLLGMRVFKKFIFSNRNVLRLIVYIRKLIFDKRIIFKTIGISIVAQFFYFMAVNYIAVLGNSNIPVLGLLSVLPMIALVASLPISIGGWGVREGAFVYGLGLLGVSPEESFLISVQIGFIGIFSTILASLLAVFFGDTRNLIYEVYLSRKSQRQE
jgi:glycosyltransferase 2 family protein